METSKTRRAAVGIFGAAAVAALSEIKSAGATGGTCRNEGGNCSGNQECCSGLTCTPTGNGNSKTCQGGEEPVCGGDHECPDDCTCGGGTCNPDYPDVTCVAVAYNKFASECNTRYGRRNRVNCRQFPNRHGRKRCQRRNRRLRARLTTCRTEAESLAVSYCTVS